MTTGSEGSAFERERLSALVDGEADAAGSRASCAHWQASAEARGDWHAWQLIGDVLRSDELASDAGHDAALATVYRVLSSLEAAGLVSRRVFDGGRAVYELIPANTTII